MLQGWAHVSRQIDGHHDAEVGGLLHRDRQAGWAQQHLHDLIRDLMAEAARSMPDDSAVHRLVAVTLAGRRPMAQEAPAKG